MKKFKGVISFFVAIFVFSLTSVVSADGFTTLSGTDSAATGEKIDFTISICMSPPCSGTVTFPALHGCLY